MSGTDVVQLKLQLLTAAGRDVKKQKNSSSRRLEQRLIKNEPQSRPNHLQTNNYCATIKLYTLQITFYPPRLFRSPGFCVEKLQRLKKKLRGLNHPNNREHHSFIICPTIYPSVLNQLSSALRGTTRPFESTSIRARAQQQLQKSRAPFLTNDLTVKTNPVLD